MTHLRSFRKPFPGRGFSVKHLDKISEVSFVQISPTQIGSIQLNSEQINSIQVSPIQISFV